MAPPLQGRHGVPGGSAESAASPGTGGAGRHAASPPAGADDDAAHAAPGTAEAIERLVAALQDPTRRGILLSFYADPSPRSVDDVAAMAGVHRTVAFGHLERLVTLGFLGSSRRRGLPGKPAKLYRLVAGPLELRHPARQFATLAGLLAESLQRFGDPGVEAAREAGRRQGEGIGVSAAASTEDALIPLTLLGGDYAVEGDRVLARNCIFEEACARAPEVICHLHAGMIEGVLHAAGRPRRVAPCTAPGEHQHAACVYELTPPPVS